MLKKSFISIFYILCSLFIFTTPALAKVMGGEKENLVVAKGETVDDDLFVAGQSVSIDGTVKGDVFVCAGSVSVSGIVKGSIFAGTGELNLVGANIGGSLVAGAGKIAIDKTSKIGGSLITGSGTLVNSAPVGRNVMAGAGSIMLDNKVGKEARLGSQQITLGPNTSIAGNLTYALEKESDKLAQDPKAVINGETIRYTPPVKAQEDMTKAKADMARFGKFAGHSFLVVGFLGSLLLGFLLLKLFPKTSLGLATQIKDALMHNIGIGFLIVIFIAPVLLVLMLTIIGLPIAGMLFLVFCIALHIAKLSASYALGRFIAKQFNWAKMGVYAVAFMGLAIFYFLRAIPGIGWVFSLLFTWAGLGAIWLYTRANLKNL